MKRALLLLALVGCGGGTRTLRIPVFTPSAGASEVYDETVTTKSEVHDEVGTLTSTTTQHRRWHRKVVELEGALVTRIAVTYEIDESLVSDGPNRTTTPGLAAGRSYVIWRDRDALEAEHADGSPITAEERAFLNTEFRQLGKTSRAEALVTGRVWTSGEIVQIEDDVIADLGLPEGAEMNEATLTWSGAAGDVVVLHASFSLTTKEGFDVQQTSDGRFDRKTGRARGSETTSFVHGKVGPSNVVQTITSVTTVEAE